MKQECRLLDYNVRSEVFMAVKTELMVFWVDAKCNVMVGYQRFGGSCCHLRMEAAWSSEMLVSNHNTR
jgi:hypothetical protein